MTHFCDVSLIPKGKEDSQTVKSEGVTFKNKNIQESYVSSKHLSEKCQNKLLYSLEKGEEGKLLN